MLLVAIAAASAAGASSAPALTITDIGANGAYGISGAEGVGGADGGDGTDGLAGASATAIATDDATPNIAKATGGYGGSGGHGGRTGVDGVPGGTGGSAAAGAAGGDALAIARSANAINSATAIGGVGGAGGNGGHGWIQGAFGGAGASGGNGGSSTAIAEGTARAADAVSTAIAGSSTATGGASGQNGSRYAGPPVSLANGANGLTSAVATALGLRNTDATATATSHNGDATATADTSGNPSAGAVATATATAGGSGAAIATADGRGGAGGIATARAPGGDATAIANGGGSQAAKAIAAAGESGAARATAIGTGWGTVTAAASSHTGDALAYGESQTGGEVYVTASDTDSSSPFFTVLPFVKMHDVVSGSTSGALYIGQASSRTSTVDLALHAQNPGGGDLFASQTVYFDDLGYTPLDGHLSLSAIASGDVSATLDVRGSLLGDIVIDPVLARSTGGGSASATVRINSEQSTSGAPLVLDNLARAEGSGDISLVQEASSQYGQSESAFYSGPLRRSVVNHIDQSFAARSVEVVQRSSVGTDGSWPGENEYAISTTHVSNSMGDLSIDAHAFSFDPAGQALSDAVGAIEADGAKATILSYAAATRPIARAVGTAAGTGTLYVQADASGAASRPAAPSTSAPLPPEFDGITSLAHAEVTTQLGAASAFAFNGERTVAIGRSQGGRLSVWAASGGSGHSTAILDGVGTLSLGRWDRSAEFHAATSTPTRIQVDDVRATGSSPWVKNAIDLEDAFVTVVKPTNEFVASLIAGHANVSKDWDLGGESTVLAVGSIAAVAPEVRNHRYGFLDLTLDTTGVDSTKRLILSFVDPIFRSDNPIFDDDDFVTTLRITAGGSWVDTWLQPRHHFDDVSYDLGPAPSSGTLSLRINLPETWVPGYQWETSLTYILGVSEIGIVPEPGTGVLVSVGVAVLALRRRR